MNKILDGLNNLLLPLLPADIYSRLDILYNGAIIVLGAGVVLMLLALVLMILSVRKNQKRTARA